MPLHIIPAARASASRSRDDPAAIQARIRAVSLSTTACSLATFLTVTYYHSAGYAWHMLGYWPLGLLEAGRALLLTGLLFAGPLYERLIIDGAWESWLWLQPLSATWQDWPTWRNYVAVSPSILAAPRNTSRLTYPSGPGHGGVPVSIGCGPSPACGQRKPQASDISIASCVRLSSRSPFLRIPNHSPSDPTIIGHC